MCGIVLTKDQLVADLMMSVLRHRGHDEHVQKSFRGLILGFNRLAIVNTHEEDGASQPLETEASIVAFNGEIYNQKSLYYGMLADAHKVRPERLTEIHVIEALMRRTPGHFERFLDGYYAIVRIDKGRQRVILSRDPIGVMPLYYQKRPAFAVASEAKVLSNPIEVQPGDTLTFNLDGKLMKRRHYDPISLHLEPMDPGHLAFLFRRAVARRVFHSEKPVCVALSGGVDSAMVLAVAASVAGDIEAVTVCLDPTSAEATNAVQFAAALRVKHRLAVITPQQIERDWASIMYHLEDVAPNKIKRAAMIRNYYVAKYAPGTVILCGEGADELGGGYPPHLVRRGLEKEWKCYSTLRSMHAINLDRVNKGGMAFTKEFRVPFLDRALVQYVMGCVKHREAKGHFRELAESLGVPDYILDKAKYSQEEETLWTIVTRLSTIRSASSSLGWETIPSAADFSKRLAGS